MRLNEIEQSMRIVEQGLREIPDGPIRIDDPRYVLPEKHEVYGYIEGLMHHFKLIMEGVKVPRGEVYQAVEGGNGELGFYIVSDGSGRPYRVRVRPPCFYSMGALGHMLTGPHDRRHHHHLRHGQHDRRRVRPLSRARHRDRSARPIPTGAPGSLPSDPRQIQRSYLTRYPQAQAALCRLCGWRSRSSAGCRRRRWPTSPA